MKEVINMKELIKTTIGVAMVFIGVVLFLMNGAVTMLAGVAFVSIGGCMIIHDEEEEPSE